MTPLGPFHNGSHRVGCVRLDCKKKDRKTMTSILRIVITAIAINVSSFSLSDMAFADDPDFISFSAGKYDWDLKNEEGVEFRLEYRSNEKFWGFKPLVALAGTSTGQGFLGAGLLLDVYLGRRFVFTPSVVPHLYVGGSKKLDLGHIVEIRSQLEASYRFDDRSRLGVAVSHYSNAGMGDTNMGTESAMVYYSVPFDKLFKN
jgi:lipid A 3-O-deacylase